MGCGKLKKVVIPESVTSISYNSFATCSSLENIVIPKNVTSIGDRAFGECTALSSVNIPNGVTTIGNGAFENCTALKNITIEGEARFDADDVKKWFQVDDISDITITGSGYAAE